MNSSLRARIMRACTVALLGAAPLSALACGAEPYVGQVCTFAFDWCPSGYVKADGRQLPINGNEMLYSLIGVTYGGDARTYFNVPDLRGRSAVGTGVSDYGTNTTIGQKGGRATVSLTANNLAPHTHSASVSLATGSLRNGPLSLPVSGGTVTGQTISGSVTVNALNGATAPGSAASVPTASANTVGKIGLGTGAFYPQGSSPVAVPSTHNLAVSDGTVSGASATGNVAIPAAALTLPVAVSPNLTNQVPVATVSPNLGLTACVALSGLYPQQP